MVVSEFTRARDRLLRKVFIAQILTAILDLMGRVEEAALWMSRLQRLKARLEHLDPLERLLSGAGFDVEPLPKYLPPDSEKAARFVRSGKKYIRRALGELTEQEREAREFLIHLMRWM
jgi:hypothetical protein